MSPPIGLLINPRAGGGAAARLSGWLTAALHQRGVAFQVFTEAWPDDLTGFGQVWLVGGDGTVNHFINRYPECRLPLALFPGGTGNDFFWKLYGDVSAETLLNRLLSGQPTGVDAGRCNGRLFINGIGLGFDGQVLQSMHLIRFVGGHAGYLLAVLYRIFSFREPAYRLTVDHGPPQARRLLLLLVSNAPRTGGGFLVSPLASLHDGRLNLLECRPLPWFKRIGLLLAVEKGRHLGHPAVSHALLQQINITATRPVWGQADGELISGQAFAIEVLPARFRFLH